MAKLDKVYEMKQPTCVATAGLLGWGTLTTLVATLQRNHSRCLTLTSDVIHSTDVMSSKAALFSFILQINHCESGAHENDGNHLDILVHKVLNY